MIKSLPNQLIREDWKKAGHNALVFLTPALIALLGSIAMELPKEASWSLVALYLLNGLTDLLKKFRQANRYK